MHRKNNCFKNNYTDIISSKLLWGGYRKTMENKNFKKSSFAWIYIILIIASAVLAFTDHLIIAGVLFMTLIVIGFMSSSSSYKAQEEWINSKFSTFLDSYSQINDVLIQEEEARFIAPIKQDEEYTGSKAWNFVYQGRELISQDISFGTVTREYDGSEEGSIDYHATSRARIIKTDINYHYPLIKIRSTLYPEGASDEEAIITFGDADLDARYVVSVKSNDISDSGFLQKVAPVLKKHSDSLISVCVFENTLYTFCYIEKFGIFTSNIELDEAVAEQHLNILKEHLEMTKEIADLT